ncbi:MAG: hypothetical protein CSA23_00050 [Deltaproteobacteria bacterium]|nr:MAG: hypothetical protein CSA23_00050 [Deltaproteobacteria bacterium]
MIDKYEVPSELQGSFKRIARRVPVELKKDEDLIQTLIAYLQLGGEKLARQAVEAARQTLALETTERRKKAREEALIRAAEARLAAKDAESEDGEFGDGDEDDEAKDLKEY